jgi:hypothetical protein
MQQPFQPPQNQSQPKALEIDPAQITAILRSHNGVPANIQPLNDNER